MIKTKESLKLARIKFKTRKLRNIFSGCAISLGIIIILVFLIGITGFLTTAKKIFKDSLSNRYFAIEHSESSFSLPGTLEGPVKEPVQIQKPVLKLEKLSYAQEHSTFKFKALYEEKTVLNNFYSLQINDIPSTNIYEPQRLLALDAIFIKDFLYNNYSFEDNYNNEIPVIISQSFITSLEQKNNERVSDKDKYNLTQNALQKYLGRTYTLVKSIESGAYDLDPNSKPQFKSTDIKVKIVGFSSESPFTGSLGLDFHGIIVPQWAIEKSPNLKKEFESSSISIISEFNSRGDRDSFVKAQRTDSISPVIGRYEFFAGVAHVFRNIGLGIGGFFLVISALFILTTVSKIVADSKREIGVFRAVGAQKFDIKKIFFSYSFLLTTFGFIIGFSISVLFNTIISLLFGSKAFYAIANYGTALNVSPPFLMFVRFPILEIIILYIVTLFIALIATYLPARRASRLDPIIALREG